MMMPMLQVNCVRCPLSRLKAGTGGGQSQVASRNLRSFQKVRRDTVVILWSPLLPSEAEASAGAVKALASERPVIVQCEGGGGPCAGDDGRG